MQVLTKLMTNHARRFLKGPVQKRRLALVGLVAGLCLWMGGAVFAQEAEVPAIDADGVGEVQTIRVFDHFVKKGGVITWAVLMPLSVIMMALVIDNALAIRQKVVMPPDVKEHIEAQLSKRQFRQVVDLTSDEPSMLSFVIHSSLNEAAHGYAAMQRALEEAVEERVARLLRKIELLNVIGNISPMIGLFGTVFGMIVAFQTLVESGGQPDPGKLAGGISVALVTTFWGLLVGIPALTAFAVFRNRIDGLSAECALMCEAMLHVFRPGARGAAPKTAATPTPKPAAPPPSQVKT